MSLCIHVLCICTAFYMEEHLSRSGSEDICKFTNGEHTICSKFLRSAYGSIVPLEFRHNVFNLNF